MPAFNDDLKREIHKQLFDTGVIKEESLKQKWTVWLAKRWRIKATYDIVANKLSNIPWYFIATVHCMKALLNFKTHLYNGDPLSARTVQFQKGGH